MGGSADPLLRGALLRHPEEAAALLRGYPVADLLPLFAQFLDVEGESEPGELAPLARLLTSLLQSQQAALLEQMDPAGLVAILLAHQGAEIHALVNQLEPAGRERLLAACEGSERSRFERLFASPPGTVAGIMTAQYLRVMADETVDTVRQRIRATRNHADMPIYCVDGNGALGGEIPPLALIAAEPDCRVGLLAVPLLAIGQLTPVDLLRRPEVWGEIQALPVVESENRLVGVVRRAVVQPGDHYAGATLGQSLFELLGDYVKVTSELAAITFGRRG